MSNNNDTAAPTPALARPNRVAVVDNSPLSFMLDTARFEHMYRIAEAMAHNRFIPAHIKGDSLKETTANCFRVVNQAIRWGFDPFSVIDETYVVSGRLGYQGKLVAAVVNARCGLSSGLRPIYNARKGDDFAVVVYATDRIIDKETVDLLERYAEDEDRRSLNQLTARGVFAVRLTVGQAKTKNAMWTSDPEQKLFYSAATKWARRHKPEVILGVLTEDDAERMEQPALEAPPLERTTLRKPAAIAPPSAKGPTKEAATVEEPDADQADDPAELPRETASIPEPERVAAEFRRFLQMATLTTQVQEIQEEVEKQAARYGARWLASLNDDFAQAWRRLEGSGE